MESVNFQVREYTEDHTCESYRDGDWIVFVCPHCVDYERRLNWRTGDMSVKDHTDWHIRHSGEYFPSEYEHAFTCTN